MEDKNTKLKQKSTKIENNCIFSEENVNTGHQPEIDYLKTLDVFLIVFSHVYEEFSKGILIDIIVVLVWIVKAGSPMLVMGMGMKYSRHHEAKNYISRGIILLTLSQFVNLIRDTLPNLIAWWITKNKNFFSRALLILQADILSFCGIAFIVLGILKKMKLSDRSILIIGIIINSLAYALFKNVESPDNFLLSQFLGYFVTTKAECFFPFCSYFIFVAFGYWLGGIYQKISNKDKFYNYVLMFCLPTVIIYHYFRIQYNFPMLPEFFSFEQYCLVPGPDGIVTCLNNLVFLALFYKLDKMLKGKTPEFIIHASKNLNQYYIISYVLIVQIQTFLMVSKGEEFPFTIKYTTIYAFLIVIFCRILIDMNDKYIHFTITTLKNPNRNYVFTFIWVMTIISVIYIYPRVEVYATLWNNYLYPEPKIFD